jgi:hypothetical protein
MNAHQKFLRFSAICCFLSVLTTLGIHLYFPDPPTDFDSRVQLYHNKIYLLNRWWVIVHCLLVLISMWGFTLVQFKKAAGFAGLGFVFLTVFAFAEISRQLYVLFYINELREQYVFSTDPVARENLKLSMNSASLMTAPFFGLFILSFGLGNLCFGLSLQGDNKFDKILSTLLLTWGCCTLIVFGNSFWENQTINRIAEHYNYTFQPVVRGCIAVWLWYRSSETT